MYLEWVLNILKNVDPSQRPILIGISGPQGIGKSTLTQKLVEQLEQKSLKSISISIDDFYLTRKEQITLAQQYPTNPYLQQRGYPGTHDIALGATILKNLKNIKKHKIVRIPVYDKSKHQGQGDRCPESEWKEIAPPLDIIFLDGWMLGFTPTSPKNFPNENFKVINEFLKEYAAWYQYLDAFLQLLPEDIHYVIDWRAEAEQKMRAQEKVGMSDEEIRAYVQKFIPAYQTYLPQLEKHPPVRKNYLKVKIGENRSPVLQTCKS